MKNNHGITLITLVITIIVIILIASITIYSGLHTIDRIRKKVALDNTNAIYLALVEHESYIPSGIGNKMLSETTETVTKTLNSGDYGLMGLDYKEEDFTISFTRSMSGDYTVVYNFTYVDDLNNTFDNLIYSYYLEKPRTTSRAEFDLARKINRPVVSEGMIALRFDEEENRYVPVNNVYTENWYNYDKGFSKLAVMECGGDKYVWIPRFAYRIQDFYFGKSYDNVPSTAVDIVFLRNDTLYMANDEVLADDFTLHPAFANGETGFWIMIDEEGTATNIDSAVSGAGDVTVGGAHSHLMKNSEYAATLLLSKYFDNFEVNFDEKEFVAAIFGSEKENFDSYATVSTAPNYFLKVRGHALSDTPWNVTKDLIFPDIDKVYLVRDIDNGGYFYYEATERNTTAVYRRVIPE